VSRVFSLLNEQASEQLASGLSRCLQTPALLIFSGEIGAGKTTFIRAMLRSMGVNSAIKSPTFSLVESYQLQHLQFNHFDLYRIQDEMELDYMGFRDYFSENAICCVEWPERAPYALADADLRFNLVIQGSGRLLHIDAMSETGEKMLSCLESKQ